MVRKFIRKFSVFDLMVISLLAALGIAIKAVIVPFVHMLTGPLFIPGGAIAGGIYMLFIVLAVSLTGKPGAAVLCGFVQAIMVLVIGVGGHHGPLTIVSYSLTGLSIDLLMVLIRHKGCCHLCCFFAGLVSNLTGTIIVNMAFFQLPFVPLMLILCSAALSGGLGGLLAGSLTAQLKKLEVLNWRS